MCFVVSRRVDQPRIERDAGIIHPPIDPSEPLYGCSYDPVIRVNPALDDTLVGRPFLHDRLVVVAGPDMARSAGEIMPAVARGSNAALNWHIEGFVSAGELAFYSRSLDQIERKISRR